MRLSIRHKTVYAFEPEALKLALRLRLWPSEFEGQKTLEWKISVNGAPVSPLLTDDFGDQTGQWHSGGPVAGVEIVAEGVVETTESAGVVRGLGRQRASGVFLRETELTRADDAICELAAEAAATAGDDGTLATLHALSAAVREAVDYKPGATDADTSAARALAMGAGVCQDHAHVFISAARSLGIPARYVSGYLLATEEFVGAGEDGEIHETHAWAEAFVEGFGWVGFDAANQVCPTERYVRLVGGLDARDAAPIRGSITGAVEETLEAEVRISPAAQVQTQQQ
ncbi:transglutaminase domain-containing protein [Albimonas pacifica]|uniref:Transglutaminase-like enzyme, putative cysteine protease n=1 Tax=Albimonas pacifica TaxID=1114924 RepID=A0A1I3L2W3_9RHOB|nr:transglutaminase family protein [Albimonas pacifica]SFI78966.1 Transglutaminase-like enzyme, putative cysteine protease [Albimonas pacifica]